MKRPTRKAEEKERTDAEEMSKVMDRKEVTAVRRNRRRGEVMELEGRTLVRMKKLSQIKLWLQM